MRANHESFMRIIKPPARVKRAVLAHGEVAIGRGGSYRGFWHKYGAKAARQMAEPRPDQSFTAGALVPSQCSIEGAKVCPQTIALVDDDRNILTSVAIGLQAEGFATRVYADGATALRALLDNPPDLAVFDIKMPRMDGLELLQRLREKSAMPVIFLTSRDEEPDEALGLAMGADDYISKPFSQRLLVARIRALLRRVELARGDAAQADADPATTPPEAVRRGRLSMDPARHQVLWNERAVSLTVTEFLILEALAARPGVIKSRDQLMDAAYSDDIYVDDRTIDSHIKRLRRKFRAIDPHFAGIETLYGAGYAFADADSARLTQDLTRARQAAGPRAAR